MTLCYACESETVKPLTLESLDTGNVHEPGWFQLKMQIYGLSN